MNLLARLRPTLAICALSIAAPFATAADSPELTEARARLLEKYEQGSTDEDNAVKQLKAKIAALEYVAAAKASPATGSSPRAVNVNFPGGTFAEFIAAANKGGHDGFNVIAEAEDLKLQLPSLSIRNADPDALATALDALLQPRGYLLDRTSRTQPGQAPVFVLKKGSRFRRDSSFHSFQLASYLEHQSVEDIVAAIRMAWELDPKHDAASMQVKYHPPTSILLVSGPEEAIRVANAVLGQLRKSSPEKVAAAERERLESVAEEAMKRGQKRQKMSADWEKAHAKSAPPSPPADKK